MHEFPDFFSRQKMVENEQKPFYPNAENSWILDVVKFVFLCIFYIVSCLWIFVSAATFTKSILIFFNKETSTEKGNFCFRKRRCILEFKLDDFFCSEFIFCSKSWLHFVWNACLFWCSTDKAISVSRQGQNKIKNKVVLFLDYYKSVLSFCETVSAKL